MTYRDLRGFTGLAEAITEEFGLDPPMQRQQVAAWSRRRTLNRDGVPFPDAEPRASSGKGQANRHGPLIRYDTPTVIAWCRAGVPMPHNSGWRDLPTRTP